MAPLAKNLREERQLLVLILVVSLAVFAIAFTIAGVGHAGPAKPTVLTPKFHWMGERVSRPPLSNELTYVMAELFDPSLGALPNAHGFSRSLWDHDVGVQRQPLQWRNEPAFLDLARTNDAPALLAQAAVDDAVRAAIHKLPPESAEPITDPIIAAPVLHQTVLRVVDASGAPTLQRGPVLPVVSSAQPLPPTRLRVGVGPDGVVRFAMLDRSCGNEAADALALDAGRQLRFTPRPATDTAAVTWVVAQVFWATEPSSVPPSATPPP